LGQNQASTRYQKPRLEWSLIIQIYKTVIGSLHKVVDTTDVLFDNLVIESSE
jgi:hypothetical protein